MKRIKEKDWTSVLQERLQDAELPREKDFAPLAAKSSRRAAVWPWWVLAGLAAAAVAAVLLLRPSPRAVNAVPADESLVAQNIEPTTQEDENSRKRSLPDGAAGNDFSDRFAEKPISAPLSASGREESAVSDGAGPEATVPRASAYQSLQETNPSSNEVQNEDEGRNNDVPSSEIAENEDGIPEPEQSSDRPEQAQSLSELALADLTEFPEEAARPRRKPAGRVSLRLQAATAGLSFSNSFTNGILPMSVLNTAEEPGQWYLLSALGGATDTHFSYSSSDGLDINSPNLLPSEGAKWVYVQGVSETKANVVMVQQAPAIPITFGLSLSLPMSRSWAFSAGLDYTQRAGNRVYLNVPQSLTLHYLGIPVDLQYYFNPDSRWRFYLGAGVHAAKCIYATGGEPLQDPVLFSGNFTAGTDFRLFPGVRLYVAPAMTGHFNRSAYVNDWDDKLQFQLRAGLSFDL